MSSPFFAPERYETERFVLRSWLPGDGAALTEAVEASYEHLSPWMGWAKAEQPVAQSEAIVRRSRAQWLTSEDFVVSIWDPEERRVLGGCGYHLRRGPLQRRIAEIGMWIRGDAAGQGLGTAALVAMAAWGFSPEWPWARLVWECHADNVASQRTADKAGFQDAGQTIGVQTHIDGTWRSSRLYLAIRDTWKAPTDTAGG